MLKVMTTAQCDTAGCGAVIGLDSATTQPYVVLTKAGWRTEIHGDQILTFCARC